MNENSVKYMSAHELMLMDFPQRQFCVQDFLPKGLSVLTCDDVTPARNLAMDMSLRVAAGEKLWDMEVKQGAVLYLINRITLGATRHRIAAMVPRVPDELYVGVMIEDSLELALKDVQEFLHEHKNVSLVVIETHDPAKWYDEKMFVQRELLSLYSSLRKCAIESGIAIMVVQQLDGCDSPLQCDLFRGRDILSDKIDAHLDLLPLEPLDNQAILQVRFSELGMRVWSIDCCKETGRWNIVTS